MLVIKASRLVLRATTLTLARAELESPQLVAEQLGASIPRGWPPPLNDEQSMRWVVDLLETDPDSVGWAFWYFLNPDPGELTAIGNGGFKGKPSLDGTVEVGYSVMAKHQGNGFATEAVMGLLNWAFSK